MKFITKSLLALVVVSIALILGSAVFFHGWVVPNLNELRPRIEAELSSRLGRSVRIAGIFAKSSGLLPSFTANGVQILDTENKPVLEFEQVEIAVSPQSILTLDIDRIALNAPSLAVTRDGAGQITIAGFKIEPQATSNKASDWLFSQKEIIIKNGTLRWQDDMRSLGGLLTNVDLSLKNGLRSHAIDISAKPDIALGDTISVKGRFTQPLLEIHAGHWQSWTGHIEAHTHGVPKLAGELKAHADWPIKNVNLEGQNVQLASLPKLLKALSISVPQSIDIAASTQLRLPELKAQATNVQSDKLQIKFDASLSTDHLDATITGTWEKTNNHIDTSAVLKQVDLAGLHRYVPDRSVGNIKQRIQSAIQAGLARNVRISYSGAAEASALVQGLNANGDVVGAHFSLPNKIGTQPAPWTHWTHTQFSFNLSKTQLELKNVSAQLAGLAAKGSIKIGNIQKPSFDIDAKLSGNLSKVLDILKTAPLNDATENFFQKSTASGQTSVNLQLSLPLDRPEQNKITGHLDLVRNDFSFNPKLPPLSQMTGRVEFSQNGFHLENLQGKLLGGDVKFSGNAKRIMGSGTIGTEGLSAIPDLRGASAIIGRLQGQAPYQFLFEPQIGGAGLVIDSSLQGMQIDLPAPLNKSYAEVWPLKFVQTKTSEIKDKISFKLANLIHSEFIQETTTSNGITATHVLQGGIAIGAGLTPTLAAKGVNAYIKLAELDVDIWRASLPKFDSNAIKNPISSDFNTGYMPTNISAEIKSLRTSERHFDNLVLTANQIGNTWQINAKSNDFNGYAELRNLGTGQSEQVYARLNRLSIPDANSKTKIEQFLENAPPSSLPALDLVVKSFELQGKKLGRLEVSAVNQKAKGGLGLGTEQEWRVQKLNLSNPEAEFKATGVWTPAEGGRARRVDLQFEFQASDSGALLARFGQTGALKDGKGSLIGRVAWIGSPLALHYPTLTGQLKLNVSKGQFLKVEPGGAGRFMSVLSLQALPKLLTLDFRDIFSDGFAFDSITGDAQIIQGVLSSQNLQMKSVLALVSLDGSVNLDKETQNLHALILPDINAGGASLIATLINPVVGAASYLAQLILRRPVIAAATREFTIEGSWKEPQIKQIKK